MDYTVQDPAGNEHVISGPEGASDEEILAQAQKLLSPGAVESFGRAAVNNLPLGAQAAAALNPTQDYSTALKNFNDQAVNAKAAHPVAYGAGAVTGTLAPLAIPGVGEAFEAAPIASGAALGAANAVGNTDIAQHPDIAAKQAVEGGVLGGVLGNIMPSGQKAAEGLEKYANAKTVEAAHLPPGLLNMPKEDIESLGNTMHKMGIDKGDIDDKINIAGAKLKQLGQEIGAMGQNVPPLSPEAQEQFINELHDKIKESSDIFGAGANPDAPLYQAGIDKLSQPGLKFEDLQKLKTAIGQRAYDSLGNVKNDAAANLYGTYKDAMKSMIQGAPEDYQDKMTQYGDLLDINHALGKTRGIQNAGGAPAKGFGLAGKMGAMITGGNIPATAGMAAAIGPAHPFMGLGLLSTIFTNPEAMATGARTGAEMLPTAATGAKLASNNAVTSYLLNTLNQNPQKLGKYAQPLINAAKTGGSQGLAAQHYILSSNYPEYNEMMLKQENDNAQ